MKKWAFYYITRNNKSVAGSGKSLLNLIDGLSGRGVDRTFVTQENGAVGEEVSKLGVSTLVEPLHEKIDKFGGEVIDYNIIDKLLALTYVIVYNKNIKEKLDKIDIEGVWARGARGVVLTGFAAYWLSVPLIWDIGVERRSRGVLRIIHSIGLVLADRVVTQANTQPHEIFGSCVSKLFSYKFTTIYPGIGGERERQLRRAASKNNRNKGHKRIVCVGSIHPRKNQIMLIRSFSKIASQFPDTTVQIVGPVKERSYHQVLCRFVENEGLSSQVEFLGWRDDVPELLGKSDMLALCSHREGVPHVIREAMFAELPVIATSVGGVPEAVEDGQTGFLIPPDDVHAMRRRLTQLLKRPDTRKEMGKRGLRLAQERFSREAWLSKYGHLLRNLS